MALVASGVDFFGNMAYWDTEDNVYYGYDPSTNNYYLTQPVSNSGGDSRPPYSTPVATYPVGGGGVYIQPGSSWYNDLLNTILGISALENRGTVGASGVNPQSSNPYYNVTQNPQQQNQNLAGNIGGNLGSSLQQFVSKNALFLLLGGGLYFLYASGRKK